MEHLSSQKTKISPTPRWEFLLIAAILGVAVLLRLYDLAARNLWTDEAWVALAALAPTPGEALTLGRSTPSFYTLTLWALVQVFGNSEAVLRSLSFVFGVGAVVFFWLAARRLTSRPAALLGLTLVALSPVLVYFSKELKQYSGDAFFAVLVVWLAEGLLASPSRGRWLTLALVGPLALGFSHGAVFVLPTALGALWLEINRTDRPRLLGLGVFWGLAAAAFYLLVYRGQVDPKLVAYWAKDFPDFSGLIAFFTWFGGAWSRYFHYFFNYFFSSPWGWLWGMALVTAGVITLIQRSPRRLLLYWGGPLILAFAAAALHRFPFMGHYNGSRLLLFSAPWLYLIAALGTTAIFIELWRRPWRWLAPGLAALILITSQPLALIQEDLRPQANRQELKPLANYLKSHLLPNDRVYVYFHAIYPFKYYFQGNPAGMVWGKSCVETDLDLQTPESNPPQRLWLVAAHFRDLALLQRFAARLLGPDWHQQSLFTRQNAALFLFVRQDQATVNYRQTLDKPPRSGTAAPLAEKACAGNPPPLKP
ncbi:MAG: glycosyltransferase family 39 protein [Thermodesulfobacteriota bacterium]